MYDWDTAYVSQILHNPVYAGNLTVADKLTKTMRSKKRPYIPYAERESSMARMSRLSNRTVGTTCRRFCRAERPLSWKAQADMTTSSEGLSSAPIAGVPCLPKSSRKESGTMYQTRLSTAVPSTVSLEKTGVHHTTLKRDGSRSCTCGYSETRRSSLRSR